MKANAVTGNRALDLNEIDKIKKSGNKNIQVYLAAKYYISLGIYVLPLIKNGKSLPYKDYSINYGSASRNLDTIEKWFHPHDGRFAGWNIGIATGKEGGIFAVDVDMHGDVDGLKELEALCKEYEPLPNGPVQETPSGGHHYIFNWQENASSSTGKIGKAIDTRGGTDKSSKGHIVVFPSIVNGKEYNWVLGGEIPNIPKWVMEKMGVTWRNPNKKMGRGNENVGTDDEEMKVPIEQIKRMIEHINPDDLSYDEWLRVGMAIKSQYQGEDGLKIWDDWSAQGSRYKQNECHIRWDGFDDFGEIRIGTLFFFAKDSGWEPTKDDVKANKYDELVEKMNKTYAIVMVGGKIRILREKSELSQATGECYDLLGKEDFKTLLQNDTIEVADAKGRVKNISVANIWLAHGGRRTYPNGMGLFPEGAPLGWYNTWTGFSVEPIKGQCDLFLDHVKEVICNGNVDYYNWVIDWCADCIQDPSNPKGTAIVLRGEEGAGKGTLANTIGQLFGSHYRHLIDDSHLLSNFNAHMIDALFVFADEITWGGNIKTSGKLKGMVTEKYLIGERKGVDAVGYRNMIHMMIASNSSWVIPAGTNSRRWFVLDVSDKKVNDTSYFNAIQDELNNGGLEALLYYLLNRKITNNLRRALETKALQEQRARGQSGDSVLQWWLNALYSEVIEVMDEREIDPSNDLSWPFIVNKINLYKDYKEWCETNGHKFLSMNVFFVEIQRFGFIKSRPSIKGKRIQVYQIPTIEEAKDLMKSKYNIDVDGDDNDQ